MLYILNIHLKISNIFEMIVIILNSIPFSSKIIAKYPSIESVKSLIISVPGGKVLSILNSSEMGFKG